MSPGLVNGDLLLTSGLGGYYPSGLGIGSVEEVRTDDNGLTKYAVIAPLVDMQTADRGVRHHGLRHRGLRGRA